MRLKKYFLLLSFFLLTCQIAFAQTSASKINIKIEKGKCVVSGAVSSESARNEIVEKVKNVLGGDADFSQIKIDSAIKPFAAGWQKSFDNSLSKLKTWKSGVFVFSTEAPTEIYPTLPDEILNTEILLTDGERVRVNDFSSQTVALFLVEAWCGPCVVQAKFLRELKSAGLNNVEVIGVSFETSEEDRENFRRLQKILNYKLGWADLKLREEIFKISKFNGVPQVFLIRNGRLYAIFVGNATSVNEKMKEVILQVSNAK